MNLDVGCGRVARDNYVRPVFTIKRLLGRPTGYIYVQTEESFAYHVHLFSRISDQSPGHITVLRRA